LDGLITPDASIIPDGLVIPDASIIPDGLIIPNSRMSPGGQRSSPRPFAALVLAPC
jgi:hypothetical protein